jgi:hypothetical protein
MNNHALDGTGGRVTQLFKTQAEFQDDDLLIPRRSTL